LVRKSPIKSLRVSEVIVDTSFLLPYIGLRVKEVSYDVINELREIKIHYPYLMLPELIGAVIKVAKKMGLENIPRYALRSFNSLVYGDEINLITPTEEDLRIAYELVRAGLSDLFDAILYATAERTGIKALTMDEELIEFLRNHGFRVDNLILVRTK